MIDSFTYSTCSLNDVYFAARRPCQQIVAWLLFQRVCRCARVHTRRCSLGSPSPCQEELGQPVQKSRERIQDADAVLLNMRKWMRDLGIRLGLSLQKKKNTSQMLNQHNERMIEKTKKRGNTKDNKTQVPVSLCSPTC